MTGALGGRRERRRRSAIRRTLALAAAAVLGALALTGFAAGANRVPRTAAQGTVAATTTGTSGLVSEGRQLFVASCSSCHGFNAQGISGRAPSLVGVGAQAPDFYLSTGRMPLAYPRAYPERSKRAFPRAEITALVTYIAGLGGPPIPSVHPAQGDLSQGEQVFATNCAGCHQISARGGIVTGAVAPPLQQATATEIAEAVRIGPYLMPRFSTDEISAQQLNSLTRYIISTRNPDDAGGWGIGHIGPIPEGMVAWLLALVSLLIVARVIGERTT